MILKTSTTAAIFWICTSCTTPQATVQHVEVMTFQLTKTASGNDFVAINKTVTTFLQKQDGFLSRELGKVNDSTWIDVLRWESAKHFEAAYTKSADDASVKQMSAMIDFNSVRPLSFDIAK